MTPARFADQCVRWLNRETPDYQFRKILSDTKPFLQFSEIWQAANEAIKRGRHDGPCDNLHDETKHCSIHLATGRARRERLIAALDKYGVVVEVGPYLT